MPRATGLSLTPDGTVTFYDNGVVLGSQPLAVVGGQDQAVFSLDTTTLPLGRHLITVGYTSASGNFAMSSASPVLTEIIFPADAQVLTVDNTSSDPTCRGSLPWAVAQADASSVATLITFASGSGQAFATPQTITLEAPLDVTDANSVGIEGPSCGRDPRGRLQPVAVPGSQRGATRQHLDPGREHRHAESGSERRSPGRRRARRFPTVANLGSALSVTGGGAVDLGGQSVTADTLTLDRRQPERRHALQRRPNGPQRHGIAPDLTGSGGLVKNGAEMLSSAGRILFPAASRFWPAVSWPLRPLHCRTEPA